MRRRTFASWSWWTVLGLLSPGPLVAPGCRNVSDSQCADEPPGSVSAWVEGEGSMEPIRFSGVVKSVSAVEDGGGWIVMIAEDGGADRSIRIQTPGVALPVDAGGRFRFEVQHAGESPPTSAILVWDDDGLVFAGVSDWEIGRNVVRDGISGFGIEKITSDCEDRSHGECYDSVKNAILTVTAGQESVSLYHGESGELAGYAVTCLTCQDVVYNDSCADAGLISVSYVIAREEKTETR